MSTHTYQPKLARGRTPVRNRQRWLGPWLRSSPALHPGDRESPGYGRLSLSSEPPHTGQEGRRWPSARTRVVWTTSARSTFAGGRGDQRRAARSSGPDGGSLLSCQDWSCSAGVDVGGGARGRGYGSQRGWVAGPGELRRRRRRGHAVAVQVVAAVPPPESPQGIAVPADGVGDGAGEAGGVEAQPVGHAQHLPADLVGGKGRDQSGGVAGGAELPFDPAQPVGPAGQPLVDDKVG